MNDNIPRATFWARRAGAALIMTAAAIYAAFFFAPVAESETITGAAAFWGMASAYLIGGILLFTPTK